MTPVGYTGHLPPELLREHRLRIVTSYVSQAIRIRGREHRQVTQSRPTTFPHRKLSRHPLIFGTPTPNAYLHNHGSDFGQYIIKYFSIFEV